VAGPDWTARVSLANLPGENYTVIGRSLVAMMADFHQYWQSKSAENN
jgi:hypothetical protein